MTLMEVLAVNFETVLDYEDFGARNGLRLELKSHFCGKFLRLHLTFTSHLLHQETV